MIHAVLPAGPIGMGGIAELLLPALGAALAAGILARLAPALGLADHGGGHGLHRERDGHGRLLVGGLALGVGIALSALLSESRPVALPGEYLALGLALLVGLLDDRSRTGMGARAKFGLQMLPALALAWSWREGDAAWIALALALGLAAQNLANTYDNSDGVLLLSAAIALAPSRPAGSLLALAVLAFNLRWRGRASVLLGDSGSHLIALLLLCEPRAWGAFFLPALDLARVLWVRRQQGRDWWVGDRVHLAHRLGARGLSHGAVALTLALASMPAIAAGAFAHGLLAWSLGLLGSAGAFALLVRATPAVDGRGLELRAARSDLRPAGADREP